jgi:hypothetical protein
MQQVADEARPATVLMARHQAFGGTQQVCAQSHLALRGTRSARENWLRGLFLVISRFPSTLGVLRFHVHRALGQQPRRIDYK